MNWLLQTFRQTQVITQVQATFRSMFFCAVLAILVLPTTVLARVVDNIEGVLREARIVADVMHSALRSEMKNGVRVSNVSSEYLAKQGVLISVRLNTPWLTINDSDTSIRINGQINLEEIPSMVENVLRELNIDVSPYEPEALEALRSLRTEQRELREEQRDIRSRLRKNRRQLVRTDEEDVIQETEQEIQRLERELAAAGVQYDALAVDIDAQYEELRDYRGGRDNIRTPTAKKADYDAMMARIACDYGGTLKSLSSENYLTIALHRDNSTDYYAFKMEHVYSCGRNDMRAEKLLERAYSYRG